MSLNRESFYEREERERESNKRWFLVVSWPVMLLAVLFAVLPLATHKGPLSALDVLGALAGSGFWMFVVFLLYRWIVGSQEQ